ncbi:MAG TPA: S41 family peptidase, partial [Fimbriimonadaceae bacterium]|nr:S41 family peptidase [Fimbriimonadaceae bacterium]
YGRAMVFYRAVGDVPPKRHTQHRDREGRLYREELMGEEGFSSDSSLLYHRGVPSSIVDASVWELPEQGTTANHPLAPRHLRLHDLFSDEDRDLVTGRRLVLGNSDVRLSYVVGASPSPHYRNAVGDECVYIEIVGFMDKAVAARSAQAAMEWVADTDALIIDLRRNGGGHPETVQLICSYLFEAEKPVHLNSLYFRRGDRTEEFWSLKDLPGKRYLNKPVYVLTSKRTGSGAEEFSYNLKNLKRATLVGESTWGGANPGGVVRLNDHFSAFIPTGRAINPITKTNWEGTGVQTDIAVPADQALKVARLEILKAFLSKATDPEDKEWYTNLIKELESSSPPK